LLVGKKAFQHNTDDLIAPRRGYIAADQLFDKVEKLHGENATGVQKPNVLVPVRRAKQGYEVHSE